MATVKFQKKDRVRFDLAGRTVEGLVKEDRGPIGIGGRHLYLVEFSTDSASPSRIELPADKLDAIHEKTTAK